MSNSEYNFNKLPGETEFQQLKRVCIDKLNKLHNKEWTDIKEELKFEQSSDTLRKISRGWLMDWEDSQGKEITQEEVDVTAKYKSTNKLNADGSTDSDKLLKMSEAQSKDKTYLLEAHGFDPNEFELLSAQSSIWNGGNADVTLYSSKIKVKAKVNGFDINKLVESMKKEIKPVYIESNSDSGENLLTLPFVDLHYGINSYEGYFDKLKSTIEIIKSKKWDTIYIPIGNDLLHVDNFQNKTVSGTIVETVDLVKAWEDAFKFYTNIITIALENSNNVTSHYIPGNHDANFSWGLVKALEVKFPQVEWDNSPSNKKFFVWKKVTLLNLHGERGLARAHKTLLTKYRNLIVNADCVELYAGHYHSNSVKDDYGIVTRVLPTSASEDQWHESMSFEGSVKHSQLFEYTPTKIKTIYHV